MPLGEHEENLDNKLAESHPSSGGSTEDLARHYFSTLSKGEVERLYDYYKFDFDAFGYDHKEFLAIANQTTDGAEDPHWQGAPNGVMGKEEKP